MKPYVVAIIPARGGSKRIPGKNIRPFAGLPMIGHAIRAATRSGLFDRIIVSTDSEEVASVAEGLGAECPFRRPADLADDYTPTAPVVTQALGWLAEHGPRPDYACCIYATVPFIQAEDLRAGIELLRRSGAGSAFSVTTFAFPILRALKQNADGSVAMMWPEHKLTRSQDLPTAYHDAGQFYWLDVARFTQIPELYCPDSVPVVLPRFRVQDIDTLEDWEMAEVMYETMKTRGLLE